MTKRNEWYGKRVSDKGSKWKPEIGEDYYCLDLFDLSAFEILGWSGSFSDEHLFKLGNCFRTKREAQAALKRVKKALRGE